MKKADFVTEITVTDPDTQAFVQVAIYKDRDTGGMFGVDSSYILTLSDDDPVVDPFNGEEVMLIETDERAGTMLGEVVAREMLEEDDELILYDVEVGLYDIVDDPRTPMQMFNVMVAADHIIIAAEEAVVFCEENIPIVGACRFDATGDVTPVDW